IRSVTFRQDVHLPVKVETLLQQAAWNVKALLDSGANGIFIDKHWAESRNIPMITLDELLPVFNIDGTKNSTGDITHTAFIAVEHKGHHERVWAEVTDLGKVPLILGWTWLHKH
ncbi:hypothetical protein BV22DRAFT_983613, partial [Leucogyrophana mollusca]